MKKLIVFLFFVLAIANQASAIEGSITINYQNLDQVVRPGGEATVILTVSNPSAVDTRDITLQIIPDQYLISSTAPIELGNLAPGSSQQTSLRLSIDPQAKATTTYITVRATYFSDSTEKETNVNIPIKITTIPILQITGVSYNSSLIEPGDVVRLELILANNGDGAAKDIRVALNQNNLFISLDSVEKFVNEIGSKTSARVSFVMQIDPSIDVGIYSIPIAISYSDETKASNFTVSKNAGLTVSGNFNFQVNLDSQDTITPGSTGTVSVKVVNAGNQEAEFLTLIVLPSNPFANVVPETTYIGNLKSDDFSTERFSLNVGGNAIPDTYPLNLRMTYKDIYENNYTETRAVYLKVYSPLELPQISTVSPLLIVGIIIIIIIFAYLIFRRLRTKR